MKKRQSSLRRKILTGYIAGLLIILASTAIIFMNLIFLESRIIFFTVITRFVDTILEIRRYEKNYFLYKKTEDLEKVHEYIDTAISVVQNNRDSFDSIKLPEHLTTNSKKTSEIATDMLVRYRMLIQSTSGHIKDPLSIQEEIRRTGHALTELAEYLAVAERRTIKDTIMSTKRSLIVSVTIFFAGTIVIALMVSTIVIRPLKELELSMNSIASGKFEMLPINSEDKEILSLKKAFERMIKEIFSQRDIIRSEKLTSLGTMLAGIAHEINNPLSNISTSAEILLEELQSSDFEFKKELIQQIITETDRARDIVRSVLEYTRDREFKKEQICLSKLIAETLRFIKSDFPAHITLKLDIPEELYLNADKQRLQHALLNIIKNAIEAMSDSTTEGKLTITARDDSRWIVIEISDTGVGIPEENLEKIFDPFFTTKEVGKGTGLGLFITHNIIQQHNGTISVKSSLSKGTTFIIKLPKERTET